MSRGFLDKRHRKEPVSQEAPGRVWQEGIGVLERTEIGVLEYCDTGVLDERNTHPATSREITKNLFLHPLSLEERGPG